MNEELFRPYTTKEVSELIEVPPGTLRQWEEDFKGVLSIPRDRKDFRIYTEIEIDTLRRIKEMRDKNLPKDMIRDLLEQKSSEAPETESNAHPSVPERSEMVESLQSIQNMPAEFREVFSAAMNELKEEMKKEVREEISNEISSQSERIENSNKEVSEEIKELSESLDTMKEHYKEEVNRRDEVLNENMRLMQELKEEKNKNIFKKLFK